MSSLIPAPIDREVAKDGLCLERQQCFPQLFGVETTSLPYRVYQKLASGMSSRRLDRRRMVEMADEIVRRGAARAGLTWHYARPPVRELEYEMDCRGVTSEHVV